MRARQPLTRGDIVLTLFPFTDLSARSLRPALVVGHVETDDDAILAFISTQLAAVLSPAAWLLDSANPEFSSTGLKLPSVIRLDKLATLHRNMVRRRLGRIGPATGQAVAHCLRYVFDL